MPLRVTIEGLVGYRFSPLGIVEAYTYGNWNIRP